MHHFRHFERCIRRAEHEDSGGRGRGGRHHHEGGEGPRGGRGGGRVFGHGGLRFVLLQLIADKPSHGYELIKAIEERLGGAYSPSPGMVYPALTYLEEVGFVASQAEGNRKRYALTDAGRAHLDAQRERVDTLFARLTHLARKMEFMRRAFAGESAGNETPDEAQAGWLPEFVEARLALKRALLHKSAADADEQRRIAAIMRRATAEIEGGTSA